MRAVVLRGKEDLAVTMKRIGVSFAWFYNWKYKTTGHLFQDRYKSEKVEDDPAWQMLQKPAKLKKYIPPENLERLMEETTWQE